MAKLEVVHATRSVLTFSGLGTHGIRNYAKQTATGMVELMGKNCKLISSTKMSFYVTFWVIISLSGFVLSPGIEIYHCCPIRPKIES